MQQEIQRQSYVDEGFENPDDYMEGERVFEVQHIIYTISYERHPYFGSNTTTLDDDVAYVSVSDNADTDTIRFDFRSDIRHYLTPLHFRNGNYYPLR